MAVLERWIERRNSSGSDPEEFRATLVEHLDELRTRIMRALVIVVIAWIIGYQLQPIIYNALMKWSSSAIPKRIEYKEAFTSVTSPFLLKMKFGLLLGLGISSPLLIGQLWGFVKPGLKPNEVRSFRAVVPAASLLFVMGCSMCWLILPTALHWFTSYIEEFPGAVLYQEPGTLVFFIMKMLLAFGVAFQLPVIVWFLSKIGLLTPETLFQYWRQATVGIFVAAMVLTPSNDPLSMLMMAIPMTLLYIGTIFFVKITSKPALRDPELDMLP